MDLNEKSTKYAANRLRQLSYQVTELTGDARNPFPMKRAGNKDDNLFDSVGLFHLLHCIPGTLRDKQVVLQNAANALKPEGVAFGANVTPVDCEDEPNLFAKSVLAVSHGLGALNNQNDSHADMEKVLDDTFHDYKLERVGCMSLWAARNPKSSK